MTDTNTMFRMIVANTNAFIKAYEDMALIEDRLATDPNLAAELAASASAGGRTDLGEPQFEQLQTAIQLVQTLMNTTQSTLGGNYTKFPFYEII
jgi:hypothetical protein